jgi:two-component system probable response regulator PhcQ
MPRAQAPELEESIMKRILLIDDEPHVLSALKRLLRASFGTLIGIEVFSHPPQALTRLGEAPFDVVMSDYRMPEMSGIDVLRRVREVQPHAVRMILSATSDFAIIQQAINEVEVYRFLAKPWNDTELLQHIRDALARADESRTQRNLADAMRVQQGDLSAADHERRRLEELEPGITQVEWGPHGEVLMPDDLIETIVMPTLPDHD